MRAWVEAVMRRLLAVLALFLLPIAAQAQSPLAPGEHRETINGVELWYRVAGRPAGTPVVFLHGGPGEGSQTFATFAGPPLERSLRMVYLDRRGSGRSERAADNAYSIALFYSTPMPPAIQPLQSLLTMLAGWINRQQVDVIEYLKEENGFSRSDWAASASDLRMRNVVDWRGKPAVWGAKR